MSVAMNSASAAVITRQNAPLDVFSPIDPQLWGKMSSFSIRIVTKY